MKKKKIKIIDIIQNWDEQAYFVYFNNGKYSRYDADMDMVSIDNIRYIVEKMVNGGEEI